MKTRKIVPLIALAALVTACAAPIQAPILQQPKSEPATLPFQEQAKGEQALPFELPVAPAEKTAPEIPAFEVPVAPVPVPQTLPPWSWSQDESGALTADEIAQLRLSAQADLYKQGYRPPNAQLTIGQTDPSAYPAEIEAVVKAPYVHTDPSAYPAEIEAVVKAPFIGRTDPSAYPAEPEVSAAPMLDRAQERDQYESSYGPTDPSAYPTEVEAVANAPYVRTDPSAYPAEVETLVHAPYVRTDPSAYPAEVEALVHAPYIGQTDPSTYPTDVQAIAAP